MYPKSMIAKISPEGRHFRVSRGFEQLFGFLVFSAFLAFWHRFFRSGSKSGVVLP